MAKSVHLIGRYNEMYLALTHSHTHPNTQAYILIVCRAVTNQQSGVYTPCIYIYLCMYLFLFVRSKAVSVLATARCVPVVNIIKRKFYIRFETFLQMKFVKIDRDVIETLRHI